MAATTPTLGLYKPGGGSSGLITPDETVDIDKLNANADLIDAEALSIRTRIAPLEDQNRQYRGPAGSRVGLSGMRLGDEYQETDGDKKRWKYDGSNWLTAESGLFVVRPSSVTGTGVVLNADGSVTATNATAVSLNGVFSSRFKLYQLQWTMDKSVPASSVLLRMRNAGTDDAGNNYTLRRVGSNGAGYVELTSGLQGFFDFSSMNYATQVADIKLQNPAAASTTRLVSGTSFDTNGSSFAQTTSVVGEHRVATAYDGFSLSLSGSNLTGDIRVYGLV